MVRNTQAVAIRKIRIKAEELTSAFCFLTIKQPFPPLTITMDDAEPLAQPQSEPKPKERPFAEPTAPTIPDITTAPQPKPGDLVKPETKAKPETKVEDLPQPYTPDVPKGVPPQQPPLKIDPSKVIPPIIGGAAPGKLAVDKLTQAKAERTQPSLAPDPSRLPEGKVTPIGSKQDVQTTRSLQRENESAQILAKAGYKIEQNIKITEQDRLENPWLGENANPDYKVEGRIFDCLSPSSNRAFNFRDKIIEKVSGGQTRRIVLNIEDSAVSLEDLKQVLLDNPIKDLEEIIIIKGNDLTHFYPFE